MIQSSLFEEDYLLKELGQLARVPNIALTELVANAWDAGATRVDISIPSAVGGMLTVLDNGHGMTAEQFKRRWMTLRYDRLKHQGAEVEFPADYSGQPRTAYGRNGVGRHGLLCFSNEYRVETWRDGKLSLFLISAESGESPFVLKEEASEFRSGSGTKLLVEVDRKLPDYEEILTVLAARFVHDPRFKIFVNGASKSFNEIDGKISEQEVIVDPRHKAKIIVIDSTRLNHSSVHQGIAFWSQKRLVGTPSWSLGDSIGFDGRTRFARRYKVIVDTEGFESEIESDWTGFKSVEIVSKMYQVVYEHLNKISHDLAAEVIEEASIDALSQNRVALAELGKGARIEVSEFTRMIAQAHPAISPEFLATAVQAVINLEKSKSGEALLQKLSLLPSSDVEGLDELLNEWTVKDALRVLDEIANRLNVLESIKRLSQDPETDELHTLHPLILRSRWIFGPEFESQEYCSNATLQTISKQLFKNPDPAFLNSRKRPDIVVLPNKTTCQITGIETFDLTDPTIMKLQSVLLIELKKGGFELTREEVNQADGYIQDIASSGIISGSPYVCGWVVGEKIRAGVVRDKVLKSEGGSDYGRVRATTYGALVDTAHKRLMKLQEVLSDRYSGISTDDLLAKVLPDSDPGQGNIDL